MTTIIRPKNHDEWLDLRKGGIGSSEVGSVLGVNPYETPYQLWLRKTGRIAAREQNMAMRLGHLMEGTVAQLYEDATGNIVDTATEGDWCVRNEAHPYTIASPDRYCITPDGKTILLECKTTRKNVSEESTPMPWYCQVQYLLYCSGLDEGALAWLKYGSEFGYKSINANPEFQEFMLERLDRFWTDCIIGDKAPAAISGGDVSLIYATSAAGKTIEADVETLQKIAALKEKKEAAKALEDEIKSVARRLELRRDASKQRERSEEVTDEKSQISEMRRAAANARWKSKTQGDDNQDVNANAMQNDANAYANAMQNGDFAYAKPMQVHMQNSEFAYAKSMQNDAHINIKEKYKEKEKEKVTTTSSSSSTNTREELVDVDVAAAAQKWPDVAEMVKAMAGVEDAEERKAMYAALKGAIATRKRFAEREEEKTAAKGTQATPETDAKGEDGAQTPLKTQSKGAKTDENRFIGQNGGCESPPPQQPCGLREFLFQGAQNFRTQHPI